MPQRARAVLLTRPIATCFGICVLIHAVTYLLNALLPRPHPLLRNHGSWFFGANFAKSPQHLCLSWN